MEKILLTNDSIISKFYINYCDNQKIQLSERCNNNKKLIKHVITSTCFLSYKDLVTNFTEKQFTELTMSFLINFSHIEILLIGTGKEQRFPDKELYSQLHQLPYSTDFMDTAAACRTFNILANENRKIGSLLFLR